MLSSFHLSAKAERLFYLSAKDESWNTTSRSVAIRWCTRRQGCSIMVRHTIADFRYVIFPPGSHVKTMHSSYGIQSIYSILLATPGPNCTINKRERRHRCSQPCPQHQRQLLPSLNGPSRIPQQFLHPAAPNSSLVYLPLPLLRSPRNLLRERFHVPYLEALIIFRSK